MPVPTFTGFPTNLADSFDLSGIMGGMQSGGPGNNPDGVPGIRVGVNPGDQMPEELYGVLRSTMHLFGGGGEGDGAQHDNSHGN